MNKKQATGRIIGSVIKKTVSANLKLWGGNNVPYLRSAVNGAMSLFDYEKLWDKLVEPSVRSKLKMARKDIVKATNELAQHQHSIGVMKNSIATITSELYYIRATANGYANGNAFGSQVIHRVNESVLRKLQMHGAINVTVYKSINKNVGVPANMITDYTNKIKSLRDIESKVISELNKNSQSEQKLKRAQKQLDDYINSQNQG